MDSPYDALLRVDSLIQRVLLIVESMFPLGPAHQLSLLASQAYQQGIDVHIAILHDSPAAPFRAPEGCHLHHLQIQRRDWMGWKKLRKLARLIDPEICHDWGCFSFTRAAVGGQFRHVSTQLDSPRLTPADWSLKWVRFWNRGSKPMMRVVPDESLTQRLAQDGQDESQIVSIPPGLSREALDPSSSRDQILEEFGLKKDTFIVGALAPFVPPARLKDLIWAMDLITCVRDDVFFLLMGQGNQRQRLDRFLRCTIATGHVRFVGLPENALSLVSGLNAFWQSSLLSPLPIAMLEAMNSAVPAISVLGPETEKAILHQTTGMGVNFGARDEFARWTKYFIEQPHAAKQLGQQGQAHVQNQFSLDRFANAYLDLYERLIS